MLEFRKRHVTNCNAGMELCENPEYSISFGRKHGLIIPVSFLHGQLLGICILSAASGKLGKRQTWIIQPNEILRLHGLNSECILLSSSRCPGYSRSIKEIFCEDNAILRISKLCSCVSVRWCFIELV